jgi:hypothetical protein
MYSRVWTSWHRKRRTIEYEHHFDFRYGSQTLRDYLMSLLCTTVAKASASSCITILVKSSPETPGMSRSPTASSATKTSYPKRAASRAVVETQTCAYEYNVSSLAITTFTPHPASAENSPYTQSTQSSPPPPRPNTPANPCPQTNSGGSCQSLSRPPSAPAPQTPSRASSPA